MDNSACAVQSDSDLGDLMTGQAKDEIGRIDGVGSIDVWGSQYAMRIWLKPDKLSAFDLTAKDVVFTFETTKVKASAVDLSMQSGAWSNLSAAGNRRLTFADGSKIYVKVGARAMDENTALITWNAAAKPSNLDTLSFAFAYSDDLPLTKTADSVMGIGPIDTMSLTKDTVWTGSTSPFVSGTVVDLNGHDLTIAGFGEAAMFTNSVAGAVSCLRAVFDSDVTNSATAIGGNLVFVKDGTGTYTSSKVQTYTGGTVTVLAR